MNPYQFPCTCSVCGGEGYGRLETSVAEWYGGSIRHTDPQVCADNLAELRRQLEAKYPKTE